MKYHVYRLTKDGQTRWVATTAYLEDARRIYDGWARAYILRDGEIIDSKEVTA